jgi:hypothetical protein
VKRSKELAEDPGPVNQWPLAVHILYDQFPPDLTPPEAENKQVLFATKLCTLLSGGERAARIPVRLWRTQWKNGQPQTPDRVPLENSCKNVVVVLVDQYLFERRQHWEPCINTIVAEAKNTRDLILPIAIHADAARVAKAFGDVNHILVREANKLVEDEQIFQAIYTSILRLLVPTLPRVFLCHAKADGARIARKVRQYLYENSQLSCFFDMHDIPHGHGVQKSIEAAIHESVVLTIWTDKLLDSPWCQFEIIEARRQLRPMLVLDALAKQTPRLFPFLGNMPVVRWKNDVAPVVSGILLELIRAYHLEAIFRSRNKNDREVPTFGLHPPDLLDNSFSKSRKHRKCDPDSAVGGLAELFIYPDPPLKPGELEVLLQIVPGKRFLSLVEWQALRAANALNKSLDEAGNERPNPLRKLRLGISVSASDNWADLGMIREHQDDLAYNIALQLILLGGQVVWGGDLRPDGFGNQLKWIIQLYQHPTHAPQDHVAMVVPFSTIPEMVLDSKAIAARRAFAEVKLMACPVPGGTLLSMPDSKSAEGRALSALALSVMRSELAKDCHARIIVGGGLLKFAGIYPGIVEEAYEAVRHGRPLYIIAGFGGAAGLVYKIIAEGRSTHAEELIRISRQNGATGTQETLRAHNLLVDKSKRADLSFNPKAMIDAFASLGIKGLCKCNGLTTKENKRLAESQDVHEILEIVVRGITSVDPDADLQRFMGQNLTF